MILKYGKDNVFISDSISTLIAKIITVRNFNLKNNLYEIVFIEIGEENFISMGLKNSKCFLMINKKIKLTSNFNEFISIGNKEDIKTTDFYLQHHTEIENKYLISLDLGLRVLEEYLKTKKISDLIQWEHNQW